MYYSVYLNPTVDKTVYLENLIVGGTNRPSDIVVDGAGKAVNVAVVLKELGEQVCVLGFEYDDGSIISDRLSENGIEYDFVKCTGHSRMNTKIFDSSKKKITEINETGLYPGDEALLLLSKKILTLPQQGDTVIFTGSLPHGVNSCIYADWMRELNKSSIKCVLDASGPVLSEGVKESPFLIKPNVDEISSIVMLNDDFCSVLKRCMEMYDIDNIALSLGGDGAYFYNGTEMLFAEPVSVNIRSTVGAGDSMVAGILHGLNNGCEEALRCGVAAATASISLEGTKLMCLNDYKRIYNRVKIKRINF